MEKSINLFLTAKQAARQSSRTAEWYADQLSNFRRFAGEITPTDITPFLIEEFLAFEAQRPEISASTLNARYRALRAWLNWLQRRNLIDANPIAQVDEPKRPVKPPAHVTIDEYRQFVASISGSAWIDYRDKLIAELLFWSGLRAGELIALNITDIDVRTMTIIVRSGKGEKARPVVTAPETIKALVPYLWSRSEWSSPKLLASNDGNGGIRGPLTVAGLQQMLRRRSAAAGLPNLNPHRWRHGFAMAMLNHGARLSWLSNQMGHSEERTTKIYARWVTEGMRADFDAAYERITRNT